MVVTDFKLVIYEILGLFNIEDNSVIVTIVILSLYF